ncbi:hypothetical protein FFWV33_07735 [Flavobacterium faecale]|uniref:Uncharacterized protein n=1 Tax=Flavobacterium faecale TaxID=1355330 RepID=A0A2S1LCE8_9FLAO|nr:hypothetical protein FFWV33_07735 [Flavobacterium faecale]
MVWNFEGSKYLSYYASSLGYDNDSIPIMFSHFFWFVLGFFFLENRHRIINRISLKSGFVLAALLSLMLFEPSYLFFDKMINTNLHKYYGFLSNYFNPFFCFIEILIFYKMSTLFFEIKNNVATGVKKLGFYSLEI